MTLIERLTATFTAIGADIKAKQNALVSGTTIKTVNGNSLLGSGDLVVTGGGGTSQYPLVTSGASSGTITLATNTLTQLTTVQNANSFTLALDVQAGGVVNEYLVRFVTGAGVPTLTYPASIKWVGGTAPILAGSKTYLMSFVYYDSTNIDVNCMQIG